MENRNPQRVNLYYQINYELGENSLDSAYFFARWKRSNPVPTAEEYILLDGVNGKGHYVGTMLNIGINGPNLWFGKGEIKFYIDGDSEYPMICGTGTEDYFGGGWGWDVGGYYTKYSTHYLGVHFIHEPQGGEDVQQRFSMYRWHLKDPVIFEEKLKLPSRISAGAETANAICSAMMIIPRSHIGIRHSPERLSRRCPAEMKWK